MELLSNLPDMLAAFAHMLIGPESRLWPLYLLLMIVIGYIIYRRRREEVPFLSWLFPRSMYFHPSHIVDIKLFFVGRAIAILGFFNLVVIGTATAMVVSGMFPEGGLGLAPVSPVLAAVALLVVGDFATYWVHRVHHETRSLWPFHSVHHSAEVMTPITVYRKHPVYDLISRAVHGLFLGVLQGLFIGLFLDEVSYAALMGVNAGYFIFNLLGANFRHSHVWLSYGPVLERFLISPAQHQIHHSLAPRHHNKNYGEVLAIWDWMFGTLYLPEGEEVLEFGLGDAEGKRLRQRHDTLAHALVVPIRDSWAQLSRRKPRATLSGKAAGAAEDAVDGAVGPVSPAE